MLRRPGGLVLNGSKRVARIEASERGYSGLAGWSILANARGIALSLKQLHHRPDDRQARQIDVLALGFQPLHQFLLACICSSASTAIILPSSACRSCLCSGFSAVKLAKSCEADAVGQCRHRL
jgi:hypothetical protein